VLYEQVLTKLKQGNSFSLTLSGIGEFYAQGKPIHEGEFTNAQIGWILQQWVQRALYRNHPIQFQIINGKTFIYEDIKPTV
jgi:hypothetical protein